MDEIIVETTLLHASRARMSARQIIRKAEAGKKISDCHIFATVDVEIVMVMKLVDHLVCHQIFWQNAAIIVKK